MSRAPHFATIFRLHGASLLRWGLGVLFVFTGVVKIFEPVAFYDSLRAFRLGLPDFGLRLIAGTFPWLETATGLLLIANFWRETVRVLTAALSLLFVLVLTQATVRGLDLNCGCFGSLAPEWLERPPVALIRALAVAAVAAWLAFRRTDDPLPFSNNQSTGSLPFHPNAQPAAHGRTFDSKNLST